MLEIGFVYRKILQKKNIHSEKQIIIILEIFVRNLYLNKNLKKLKNINVKNKKMFRIIIGIFKILKICFISVVE